MMCLHVAGKPCEFSQEQRTISRWLPSAAALFPVSLVKLISFCHFCLEETF